MANHHDKQRLIKALRQAQATPVQVKMAAILLAVNGLPNALEFVPGLVKKGLTPKDVCSCSLGWQKETIKILTWKEADAKVEESVMRGGERCSFSMKIKRS